MRVIAGSAKRINLKTVPGLDTRPTTDRIKETLFNMLNPDLLDANFLDLFSGSGGIGIEALSRGAKHGVFVEHNRKAIACIKENLKAARLEDHGEVYALDVISALRKLEGTITFDIIFMDPPYEKGLEEQVLLYLKDSSLIHENTLLVVEADVKTNFDYLEDNGYRTVKRKEYKTNVHLFIKRK